MRWPGYCSYDVFEKQTRHGHSVKELQANTMTACNSLAKLPNLQTIKVHFFEEESPGSWKPLLLAKDRIAGLLKPLRVIRYANAGIIIKVPQDCPISTTRLAEQQRRCPLQYGELIESNEEYEGDIRHWGRKVLVTKILELMHSAIELVGSILI